MNIDTITAVSRTRSLTPAETSALLAVMRKGKAPKWSAVQDRRLVRMFGTKSTQDMAKALGRSVAAVNIRISHLRSQGVHLPGRRSWRNCELKGRWT